jgi:hypothetical protein
MALAAPLVALSWDAHGHRTITYLALDGLSSQMPAWLREDAVRHRIAAQANEPDRWKGWNSDPLRHVNYPDHFLDIELLEEFGLTLETMPRLRREYLRAMAISKHLHPELVSPHDASRDTARAHEWPGFALHAIDENYAKLQSTFQQIRIIESLDDPARTHELELVRNNAIFHMGVLSHFVGDICQPLHTTKHYNGWLGDNPKGYTTEHTIHAAMDGALGTHKLTHANLKPRATYDIKVKADDIWEDLHQYIGRSFACVETTYRLEQEGSLNEAKGRAFIIERVTDGSAMLAAMYNAAWESAKPTDDQIASFVRYDDFYAERDMAPAAPE